MEPKKENSQLKSKVMGRLVMIIGMVLILLWLLGFFAFQWHSPFVHALIVIGVVLVLFDLISSRRDRL